MEKITVLLACTRISLFYSLAPLLMLPDVSRLLDFSQSLAFCLRADRNRRLVIIRFFEDHLVDDRVPIEPLRRLRDKYERIAFFDDDAGAGCTRFEVLPFVDWYFKRHLFRDRSMYKRRLYGREAFTDYYHERYGVRDEKDYYRDPIGADADMAKLKVGWNLGVGSFPIVRVLQRLGVLLGRTISVRQAGRLGFDPLSYAAGRPSLLKVQARFKLVQRPTVGFQRRLFLERIGADPRFLTERVSQREYNREARHVAANLSPFGWGEGAFRDFEAILNGSALLKPDMSHVETWPDVYIPAVTYAALDWDGDNLIEQATRSLEDQAWRQALAHNARQAYFDALSARRSRVDEFLSLICS